MTMTQGITNSSKINYRAHVPVVLGGSLVILAGVFMILAANRILPQGTNVLSEHGIWGQIAGPGVIGAGVLGTVLFTVKRAQQLIGPIKATVYVNSDGSGPIREDHHFEFSKRIKTVKGEPISIAKKDLYLELDGNFTPEAKKHLYRDKEGTRSTFLYLPLSLFENVNEGGRVRFYFDGVLVDLECAQTTHPKARMQCDFQDQTKYVKDRALQECKQFLWKDDLDEGPTFLGERLGQKNYLFDCTEQRRTSLSDFTFYIKDQQDNGAYECLTVRQNTGNLIELNMDESWIDLSEIHLVESLGFNNLRQFWLIIPHKPEKNQFPGTYKQIRVKTATGFKSYSQDTFDPKKGARLGTYYHGCYFPFTVKNPDSKIDVSFNEAGWLEVSVK